MSLPLQVTPALIIAIAAIAMGQSSSTDMQGNVNSLQDVQPQFDMQQLNLGGAFAAGGAMSDMVSRVVNVFVSRIPEQFLSTNGGYGIKDMATGGMDNAALLQSLSNSLDGTSQTGGMFDAFTNGTAMMNETANGVAEPFQEPVPIYTGPRTKFIF